MRSDHLDQLFHELREEYIEQVQELLQSPKYMMTNVLAADLDVYLQGFDTHISRYQQLFLVLNEAGILTDVDMDIRFSSILAGPGYQKGMKVPVLRLEDDYMSVGFEDCPVDFGDLTERDIITIASVPIEIGTAMPYLGKACILATMVGDSEAILATPGKTEGTQVYMWGTYVMNEVNRQEHVDPKTLN